MKLRLLAAAALSAAALTAVPLPAHADAALTTNNCAGWASSFLSPGGLVVLLSATVHSAPAALPTTFDFANCGNNGNGL